MYPRSNCMPSTTSSSVSRDLASSTVITPSLPTLFMASARNLPISASPLAEMVPTWAISSFEVTFLEFFSRSATTASTARSIPRLRSIGFMPAATDFAPSRTIAAASTVAVVVPSPAASFVFCATSRTICAPIFSNLSASSISFATVTPSLVVRGAPKLLSKTTLRPLGPKVMRTASFRISTPRSSFSRASAPNFTSFAAIVCYSDCNFWFLILRLGGFFAGLSATFHDAHDVGLLHDQELLTIDLDFSAGPFAEQDEVACLHFRRYALAAVVQGSGADRYDLAFLGFLLRGVGNDDAAGGFMLLLDAADDHAVAQGTESHADLSLKKVSDFRSLICNKGLAALVN